jgi:hypothetical protein
MTLQELQDQVHSKSLDLMRVDRFVNTEAFIDYFDYSDSEQRDELLELISQSKFDELYELVKRGRHTCYTTMSRRALLIVAQKNKIKDYGRLLKWQLIEALQDADRAKLSPEEFANAESKFW